MNSLLMKRVGYLILGTYAIFNVISIALVNRFPIGDVGVGKYSIYSSQEFFIVYHVWGIVIAIVVMYAMWKEVRGLFMISLLLMMIVMFYPWFTAGDMARGERLPESKTAQVADSLAKDSVQLESVAVDSVPADTPGGN
ncbi:MAG: hypothetical protein AAGN35_13180 [Bacteroidota bacterium]